MDSDGAELTVAELCSLSRMEVPSRCIPGSTSLVLAYS